MLLTDDLSARVVRRDGDSAGGTLGRLLKPHFHAGGAEHVVVGTNDGLSDLHTTHTFTTNDICTLTCPKG